MKLTEIDTAAADSQGFVFSQWLIGATERASKRIGGGG